MIYFAHDKHKSHFFTQIFFILSEKSCFGEKKLSLCLFLGVWVGKLRKIDRIRHVCSTG